MAKSQRPIFRNRAVQQYLQQRQKDILPHLTAPSIFAFLWVLLGLLMIVLVLLLPEFSGLVGR